MQHSFESGSPKGLPTRSTPYKIEVHRRTEKSLLHDEQRVINAPDIIDLDLGLNSMFFHGLSKILKHGECIRKDIVVNNLACFTIHNTEIHGVSIQGGHFRFYRHY